MSLADLLPRLIRAQGGIDLASYMRLVMTHPAHGYYATRDPFGQQGDFITAPEISQVFGELVGLALAQAWIGLGQPATCLVELGPGRGTLMRDAWRATARVPGFHAATSIHLVETSPRLRAVQAQRLDGCPITWHDGLAGLPEDRPLLLVANELLDALPVRQFERRADGWHERLVCLADDGALVFRLAPTTSPFRGELDRRHGGAPVGAIRELSPDREALAKEIGRRLWARGGCALLIDYGARRLDGPTLQAVRQHGRAEPLENPGEADLSALVDFGSLAEAAIPSGAAAWGPVGQGVWLTRLGAEQRLARLVEGRDPETTRTLRDGVGRLIDASRMGMLFQVLGLSRPDSGPVPGFLPDERYAG
jgi:SAM-dependent MidA family methyltransferase